MAIFKDIILDDTGDFSILNGDLSVGESDSQHVDHIVTADLGHFRQWPLLGVGIMREIQGDFNPQELKQNIRLQLESDDYIVKQININTGEEFLVDIDAERKLS